MDIIKEISDELNIEEIYIKTRLDLLKEGNTVPFIARYRKEQHGTMDDQLIRSIADRLNYLRNLDKRKEFIDYITGYEYNKLEIARPDMVLFLTAPFDLVTKLRKNRKNYEGNVNDIHEKNLDFMKKVYDNAIFVAEYLNWSVVECNQQDEMRSIEDIHDDIYKKVKKIIK